MSKKKSNDKFHRTMERVQFTASDCEIMDLALNQVPELRICAAAVKAARKNQSSYPMKSAEALFDILPKKKMYIEGHYIRPGLIKRYKVQVLVLYM